MTLVPSEWAHPGSVETEAGLRDWARGSLPMEAGVELVLRSFGGRFARNSSAWIVTEPGGRIWLDADALRRQSGVFSGGERRVTAIVAALIDRTPVDIVDVVTGVDRANLHLILAALSHAAGSSQHFELDINDDGRMSLSVAPPLVAWPTGDHGRRRR